MRSLETLHGLLLVPQTHNAALRFRSGATDGTSALGFGD